MDRRRLFGVFLTEGRLMEEEEAADWMSRSEPELPWCCWTLIVPDKLLQV